MRIANIAVFEAYARQFDEMLARYAVTKLGRRKLPGVVRRDLLDRRNGRLLSANAPARIAFAREAVTALEKVLTPSRSRPAYFLTLIPEFGLRRAAEVLGRVGPTMGDHYGTIQESVMDICDQIKAWVAEELVGLSYFGTIEVAYFKRHPRSEIEGPILSFHTHSVVWNARASSIDAVVGRINAHHRGLFPNIAPAHQRPIHFRDRIGQAIIYALKAPMEEYGAYVAREDDFGAVWKTQNRPLRPGDAARVAIVFAGLELDRLCFEGGQELALTDRIADAARRRIRRDERREEQAFDRRRRGLDLRVR